MPSIYSNACRAIPSPVIYKPRQLTIRPVSTSIGHLVAGGGDRITIAQARLGRPEDGLSEYAILDSGATGHFFGDHVQFSNRRPANKIMTSANNSKTLISESGDVALPARDADGNPIDPILLRDVSILKGSPLNLVSIGVLCDEGTVAHFEKHNSYLIYRGQKVNLVERDGLYLLRLNDLLPSDELQALVACEREHGHTFNVVARNPNGTSYACAASYDLWHERFGHASKKRLRFLFEHGSAEGMHVQGKFSHDASCTCTTCQQTHNAKMHIGEARQFDDSITQKGQLITSDILGPFPTSVDGFNYVISFTDEYSRFSACYLLKKKSDSEQALRALISFYARHGVIIKQIRTDCGGEFGGGNTDVTVAGEGGALADDESLEFFFKRVCAEHKITHVPMPANRPELHGIAERWNLTIMRMANAMLFAARLSPILWSAAVVHANMLRNRLPLRGLGPYTPYELFYNKRPRVSQLRVFGCDCYKLLPRYPKTPGQMARKRLIYVGETADRVGFRCFDPITYKFSTEFELIFEEHSARKRINSLLEYDARRDFVKGKKLNKLPLLQDDFASKDSEQRNDKLRRVFSSPQDPPPALDVAEGEGGGGVGTSARSPLTSESSAQSGRFLQHDLPGASSSTPAPFAGESPQVVRFSDPDDAELCTQPLPPRSSSQHSGAPARAPSSDLYHESTSHMGGELESSTHREHELQRERTAPSPTSEDDGTEEVPDELILGRSLRPGRIPTLRPRKSQDKDTHPLLDIDEAAAALGDTEADLHGPLTPTKLHRERTRSTRDPRHPRRPLRFLPIGEIEKDTPEFQKFRRYALENDLRITLVANPKRKPSASHKRYSRYQTATTLRELIELSVSSSDPEERVKQRRLALQDIANDSLRGYILFPQHEHNSSTHFVDAPTVASLFGTTNVHVLFSAAAAAAGAEPSPSAGAAFSASAGAFASSASTASSPPTPLDTSGSFEPQASATESWADMMERLSAEAQVREKLSIPLATFHTQIAALWDYDFTLQLNDSDLRKESAFAAAQISDVLTGGVPEPINYKKASAPGHPEREQWLASMQRERTTLESRGTWILVPKETMLGTHRPVKCKYVYKKKRLKDGSIQFKSRLVACGYSQIAGLDYFSDETYAGVCGYSSMRFLMSYACQKGHILSQADIQGAYLESHLSDTVFMEPPPDMRGPHGEPPRDAQGRELVCLLKRGLYGLKQAGHLWQQCFKEFLLRDPKYNMGFNELTGDSNIYRKVFELNGKQEELLVGIYVDDMLISSSSEAARTWFMERLEARFPVNPNSSGIITFDSPGLVLSMNIRYDRERGILQFDQKNSIEALGIKYNVMDLPRKSMPITPTVVLPKQTQATVDQIEYLSIVGSCLHIAQVSRPDIAFAVGVLSRHSATPGAEHMAAAINLVNYLYHSADLFIQYTRGDRGNDPEIYERGSEVKTIEERLIASKPTPSTNSPDLFVDADFAGDANTRRSTSGMITMMNSGPISWWSRLQKLCAQSTAESEIYAVTEAVKEAAHLKLMCEECGLRPPNKPLTVWEDNNACIQLGHGLRGVKSARHYELRLRFLNEHIHEGTIDFARINTADQLADGLTKALPGPAFFEFRTQILHSNKF